MKAKDGLNVTGISNQDFMENTATSTQAMIFNFTHWQKSLKTPESRAAAASFVDRFIYHCMGSGAFTLIINKDQPAGTLLAVGAQLQVQGGYIDDIEPLCAHSVSMAQALNRKRDRLEILGEDGDVPEGIAVKRVRLRKLLCYLLGKINVELQNIFWALIFWLAAVVDASDVIGTASDNPLLAPMLTGVTGKAKKISSKYKNKVATLAAKGDVYKSGQGVLKGLKLMGMGGRGKSTGTGNKWVEPRSMQYLHKLREVFWLTRVNVPVYSIAWDATRLSGLDTLCSAIYLPICRLAGWCPPQAELFVITLPNHDKCCCGDICYRRLSLNS